MKKSYIIFWFIFDKNSRSKKIRKLVMNSNKKILEELNEY